MKIWMLVFSFSVILGLSSCEQKMKTAYVNNFELFEQFKGKMELEARHRKDGEQKQQLLDSMKVQLVGMQQSENADASKVQIMERQYMQLMQQFNQDVEQRKAEYTDEIWKQINQYVFEYGKEQGYEYIFGSAGNGSLMYANDAKDITKEVVEYINAKYEGK